MAGLDPRFQGLAALLWDDPTGLGMSRVPADVSSPQQPAPFVPPPQAVPAPPAVDPSGLKAAQGRNRGALRGISVSPTLKQVPDALAGQKEGLNKLQELIDSFDQQPEKTNLAPLLALADSWAGTKLSQSYNAPLTPEEKKATQIKLQEQLQKGRNDLSKDEVSLLNHQLNSNFLYGMRADQFNQKGLQAFSEALDANKARGGLAGYANRINRAENLEGLIQMGGPTGDNDLDQRNLQELAIGLQSLLSGSNAGNGEQVKHLVPQSLFGKWREMAEWLYNQPMGTGQQAFVDRFAHTIAREKQIALRQLQRGQLPRVAAFERYHQGAPEAWENILQGQLGMSYPEYQEWKRSGFKTDVLGDGGTGRAPAPTSAAYQQAPVAAANNPGPAKPKLTPAQAAAELARRRAAKQQ